MTEKRILVIDDHFEMLEFLRDMLELASDEYRVLGVPSAEEGLLELGRTPFDLIITDLRLPGMSGFDLVRKVKKLRPDVPIIMITGYATAQGEKEAAELGIYRYFSKPLDTENLLAAVHACLYGEPEPGYLDLVQAAQSQITSAVHERLQTLRSDTGARFVMLVANDARVLSHCGQEEGLDLSRLATGIVASIGSAFALSEQLGSSEPIAVQYQSGLNHDLYCANVGRNYVVAIFFDAQSRRGRIGTVWVFAQRATKDLLAMLSTEKATEGDVPMPYVEAGETVRAGDLPDSDPLPSLETGARPDTETDMGRVEQQGVDLPEQVEDVDLDAFWDQALAEEIDEDLAWSGMTFEEAQRQGLIPGHFEPDQEG